MKKEMKNAYGRIILLGMAVLFSLNTAAVAEELAGTEPGGRSRSVTSRCRAIPVFSYALKATGGSPATAVATGFLDPIDLPTTP